MKGFVNCRRGGTTPVSAHHPVVRKASAACGRTAVTNPEIIIA
ncbi:MAG: hypothetical protein WBN77_03675 [Desulfobacterales bacterium]